MYFLLCPHCPRPPPFPSNTHTVSSGHLSSFKDSAAVPLSPPEPFTHPTALHPLGSARISSGRCLRPIKKSLADRNALGDVSRSMSRSHEIFFGVYQVKGTSGADRMFSYLRISPLRLSNYQCDDENLFSRTIPDFLRHKPSYHFIQLSRVTVYFYSLYLCCCFFYSAIRFYTSIRSRPLSLLLRCPPPSPLGIFPFLSFY